ncbi:MAG: branched-chain amino acid ABC transporter substrate-binding protein, partial [Solirubrobacteraceae bacterium]
YYPTRKRTFARIVPRDSVQGAAVATVMNEDACRKVYVIHDMEVYGQGLSKVVKKDAAAAGLRVVANKGYDPKASGYRSLARKVRATFADCVFVSISAGSNGVQLFKDLAAVTFAQLYGPDRVAQPTFTDPKRGGVPKSIATRIKVTSPPLSEYSYPTRAQTFFADYQKAYHKKPQPYAIYGYEAMNLILNAMKRAQGKANNKIAVNEQIHSTKRRKSVLGRYSIDRNGDTTLTDYGLYTVDKGDLLFLKVIKAKVR